MLARSIVLNASTQKQIGTGKEEEALERRRSGRKRVRLSEVPITSRL